nr:class I SAM-dependent methyltransferase [Methanosarcina horonobensis]
MGHDVTGVDLSENMLERAAANAKEKGVNVLLVQGDAEEVPLKDGEYDFIFSKYLLWTLPQPDKFLGECYRLLKDGGLMMIIDGLWFQNQMGQRRKTVVTIFLMSYMLTLSRIFLLRKTIPQRG